MVSAMLRGDTPPLRVGAASMKTPLKEIEMSTFNEELDVSEMSPHALVDAIAALPVGNPHWHTTLLCRNNDQVASAQRVLNRRNCNATAVLKGGESRRADLWERVCLALAAGGIPLHVEDGQPPIRARDFANQAREVLAAIEAGPPERSTP